MNKTNYILVLILIMSLSACGSDGAGTPVITPDTGEPTDTTDTTAPTLLVQSPTLRLIATDTSISLQFDESIDTTSFTLGGKLADESNGGVWSQTDAMNDTLTITAADNSWSIDTEHSLIVNVRDLVGNEMPALTLNYDVYRGTLYYVNAAAIDDSGDGLSVASAKQTIMAAIDAASDPATVVVASGIYNVSDIGTPRLILKEGVSLYGGYSTDFSDRDARSSEIVDQSNSAATSDSPNYAVIADTVITRATLLDGFTLQGSTQASSTNSSALSLRNAAEPVVQNNTINGGSGTNNSFGVHNYFFISPLMQNNTINGGSGGSSSTGIYNLGAHPTVLGNTIDGGGGSQSSGMHNTSISSPFVNNNIINGGSGISSSIGINNESSAPTVLDNTINGGSSATASYGMWNKISTPVVLGNMINGGSGAIASFGMRNSNSSVVVHDNTIDSGSGPLTRGIHNFASTTSVNRNIILTRPGVNAYCFYESDSGSDPVSLINNQFVTCEVLYRDEDITDIIDIDVLNALSDIIDPLSSFPLVNGNTAAP